VNLTRLSLREISGNRFRSWVVVICAFLVAGFALATFLIAQGAGNSLRLSQERLGADILVVPEGTERKIEGALLMGSAAQVRMPAVNLELIGQVPGVEIATPQLYLMSMTDSDCCSVPDMFMVAYDSATDFTVEPWLEKELGRQLRVGQSVGGTYVFVPPGDEDIKLYGYHLSLEGNLEPTGSNLDATIFFTFETAYAMGETSLIEAGQPLIVTPGLISSVLVKVADNADIAQVATAIKQAVPGVSPITSPNLFDSFRDEIAGQRLAMTGILAVVLVLSFALIVLVFSMMMNDRRREIGVLRALGATRGDVLRSLLSGATVLGAAGGVAGVFVSGLVLYFFHARLTTALGFPFKFPSIPGLVFLVVLGLAVALAGVVLAAFVPVYRISRQEPANSMRE